MSAKIFRPVPPLYYFTTPQGAPTSISIYGEGIEVFVFFSSAEKAEAYRQRLGLPSGWQLIFVNVAERLIQICQIWRDNYGCELIAIDPPTEGSPQARSPENMIRLIDHTAVVAQEHGLVGTSWPTA